MASFGPKSTSAGSRSQPRSGGQVRSISSQGQMRSPSSGGPVRSASGAKSSATARVSDRFNPKTIDPFSTAKNRSAFANLYSNGAVPCRLVHGSVKHKLAWDTQPEHVPFDPVFVYLAQGLVETVHPYAFVSRQGFKEILDTEAAADKVIPLLTKTVPHLRAALGHKDAEVFEGALDCLLKLSSVVGPHLNTHLKVVLVPISKRGMEKKYRDRVTDALMQLEQNGGKEALLTIKSKVPTYSSVFT